MAKNVKELVESDLTCLMLLCADLNQHIIETSTGLSELRSLLWLDSWYIVLVLYIIQAACGHACRGSSAWVRIERTSSTIRAFDVVPCTINEMLYMRHEEMHSAVHHKLPFNM